MIYENGEGAVCREEKNYAVAFAKRILKREAEERQAADEKLQTYITSETDKLVDKDIELQTNIDYEERARLAADEKLQANIDAEAEERQAADEKLQANIDAEAEERSSDDVWEASERAAADEKLQSNIDAEAAAREAADTGIISLIGGKVNKSVGTSLTQTVSSLVGERGAVIHSVGDIGVITGDSKEYYILSEIRSVPGPKSSYELVWERLSTETMLLDKAAQLRLEITYEAEDREAADNNLQNNINSEAIERAAKDKILQTAIDSEASERAAADETLQANIDAEVAAREADTHIGELVCFCDVYGILVNI